MTKRKKRRGRREGYFPPAPPCCFSFCSLFFSPSPSSERLHGAGYCRATRLWPQERRTPKFFEGRRLENCNRLLRFPLKIKLLYCKIMTVLFAGADRKRSLYCLPDFKFNWSNNFKFNDKYKKLELLLVYLDHEHIPKYICVKTLSLTNTTVFPG